MVNLATMYGFFLKKLFLIFLVLLNISVNALDHNDDISETLRNTIINIENQLSENIYNSPSHALSGIDAWVDDSGLTWSNSKLSDFDEQKLSFEVKLKNNAQVRAERSILNIGQTNIELKFANLLERRLKAKYFLFIEHLQQKKRKALLNQQRLLANSELNHWKIKVNSKDFRADKLQQAGLTLDSIWADEIENSAILNRFNDGSLGERQFLNNSNSNVISITKMLVITKDILNAGIYQKHNISIRKAELDRNLANKQKQRFKAQENFALNSIKLEYDNKDNDLGFSIGMKIPITNNSYDNILKERAKYYARIDVGHTATEVSERLLEKQFQLMQLQDQWTSNQKLLHKINMRIARFSKIENIDLLPHLKQEHLKRRERQEDIYIQALKEYINDLNIAGMLSAKPYRNWIHPQTPHIL